MIIAIWTISALVLALTGTYGIREALLDLAALHVGNGVRLVARQRFFAQLIRALVGYAWGLLGVWLWWQGTDASLNPVTLVLIGGNIGFTLVALSDVVVGRIVREPSRPTAAVALPSGASDNTPEPTEPRS